VFEKLSTEEVLLYTQSSEAEKLALFQQALLRGRPELEPLLDELLTKLSKAGVVVEDFHLGNIKLAPTPEGTKAKVVDVGFAYTTDPETAALINAAKKEELFQGGGQGVSPILRAVRQNQRESAQKALDFFNDFPVEAEVILAADPQQLKLALRRAGVDNEQVISYVLVPEGRGRIIDRIYEGGKADPLTVALKLEDKPVTHLGSGVFGFEGREYYQTADGNWKQKRTFWADKNVEDPRIIDELEVARTDLSVGKDLQPCSVGGAIAGLAPCLPAEIPEAAVSGERIIQEPIIESEPLPIEQVEEVITPEKILQPQRIIQEKDGVVIQSKNNLYFVDDEGKISSVYMDENYALRPREAISVDPALEEQLVDLADEVRVGNVIPMIVSNEEKFNLMLVEAAKDKEISMLIASPEFNGILINPHGTHGQYLEDLDQTISENKNLQYLQQKFAETGVPLHYTSVNPQISAPAALAGYSSADEAIAYKIFADEEEILASAQKLGYNGDDIDVARELIAQKQIQTSAGHETYHHAFNKYLNQQQREQWIAYVRETKDPAIRSAVNSISQNPAYQQVATAKDMSPEETWAFVADEVFAHRNDFHAFGPSGIPVMELPASKQELNLLKEMNVLPADFQPPTEIIFLGEGFYELKGKKYYKAADGTWKEDVSFWFDKEIEDQVLVNELEVACVSC
jgi:hypothetical protein